MTIQELYEREGWTLPELWDELGRQNAACLRYDVRHREHLYRRYRRLAWAKKAMWKIRGSIMVCVDLRSAPLGTVSAFFRDCQAAYDCAGLDAIDAIKRQEPER